MRMRLEEKKKINLISAINLRFTEHDVDTVTGKSINKKRTVSTIEATVHEDINRNNSNEFLLISDNWGERNYVIFMTSSCMSNQLLRA